MYNALIESTLPDLHFVFLHWQVWSNMWGRYDPKHENLMIFQCFQQSDSPYLFYVTCLWNHKLVNVCWPSRWRWRSNRNLLTVACNCSILVIIIIILFSGRTRSESQISKTAPHSATKLNSYMDPYPTMCSARFGVDPDYRSGSRAKSGFSDFPHYLRNLPSDLQMQYL